MKCGVIDLSSTGVSTLVAELGEGGEYTPVYKDRFNIAVTEYLDGHNIARRGLDKIIDALIRARAGCKAVGAEKCYVISTAALRNVNNLEEVSQGIRTRTGIVVNYLDGESEAYCDLVSNRKYAAFESAALIDIGGGSLELCDLQKQNKSDMLCLDFGPIKLRNKFVSDIYPTEDEAKKIKKSLRKKLDEAGVSKRGVFKTAVLVGSINDAIFTAYREFCEKKKLGSVEFTYDKYKKFCEFLATSPDRTRLLMKVVPEKINVLPTSAIILKEILKRYKPEAIVMSDCGVKEGFLTLAATGEIDALAVGL